VRRAVIWKVQKLTGVKRGRTLISVSNEFLSWVGGGCVVLDAFRVRTGMDSDERTHQLVVVNCVFA
jgi:hypothetical protein